MDGRIEDIINQFFDGLEKFNSAYLEISSYYQGVNLFQFDVAYAVLAHALNRLIDYDDGYYNPNSKHAYIDKEFKDVLDKTYENKIKECKDYNALIKFKDNYNNIKECKEDD